MYYNTAILYMFYPIAGSFLAGCHIFSLKLLSMEKYPFDIVFAVVIFTMLLSRYCIYQGMRSFDNPTIMHLILNFSVFVTFFGSMYFLKLRDFRPEIFVLGIVLFISGTYCIQSSYKV